jgi:hypothetical protein
MKKHTEKSGRGGEKGEEYIRKIVICRYNRRECSMECFASRGKEEDLLGSKNAIFHKDRNIEQHHV